MTTIALTADLDVDLDEARPLRAAAALAVASGARLVTVHATVGSEGGFVSPAIGALMARWGRSIEHIPMIHSCCDDVTDTVLDALQRVSPQLVVAGTHGRSGWLQLFSASVAEGIARNTRVPTLVVPSGGQDLVGARGEIDLRRLLVPAGDVTAARTGLRAAAWLAELGGAKDVEVVLLHVDDGTPPPEITDPPGGLRLSQRSVRGPLERTILETAREMDTRAVVMATRGRDGVVDTFAGSHTERVIRRALCPILSVPIAS
jgi:nucleotide-binding universal stress UspA family protein